MRPVPIGSWSQPSCTPVACSLQSIRTLLIWSSMISFSSSSMTSKMMMMMAMTTMDKDETRTSKVEG